MNAVLVSGVLVLLVNGCAPPGNVDDRIGRVENGLRAVTTVDGLPRPTGEAKSLAERMRNHHVPGLGIAVIDEYGWPDATE